MTADLQAYLKGLLGEEPQHLKAIDRATQLHLLNPRMCSGHAQGRLLTLLTALVKPRLAVELGTYSAYASLCIAAGLPSEGRLISIEANDELSDIINQALASAPEGKKVSVRYGEALEELKRFKGKSIDLAYIDADKREYPQYYRALKPLMKPGALMIADNTLWDGHVADPTRKDAQTCGVREFNDLVARDPDVLPILLPVRDGLTLILIRDKEPDSRADC